MSIPSIKFRPRTVSNQKPILQCYISLYGVKAPKFSTQIKITDGLRWLQKAQYIEPTKEEFKDLAQSKNAILLQITTTVNNCFTHLTSLGRPISAKSLKIEFERTWNKGIQKQPIPSLFKVYDLYVQSAEESGLEPKTISKYKKTKDHLKSFLKTKSRNDLELNEIQPLLGFQFFEYVKSLDNPQRKGKKISAGSAKRYLLYFIASMEFAFSKGYLETNPLKEVDPKVKNPKSNKTIVTEKEQLSIYRLDNLTLTERFVADISTFMFYTAFDFCDLRDFDQHQHIVEIDGIQVIKKPRFKMRKSEEPEFAVIPMNNILQEILFIKYPDYFPKYTYETVRRVYKNLCSRIGVKNYTRMSLKQIRKSAGSFYVNSGVDIKATSAKILVHTQLSHTLNSLTETKYIVIEDSTIIRETEHLRER
ncbi:phage integrase SAM-like domain-containing protein [Emticicia sp. BO119]|uniref:phage integrase SAM-like domain-containing protein n=1 Tax=Emticicia sp. BO119 TaxID=2757768 RepID=UPI0015F1131A|nr:phage integrase SAM-like domain-containing protein [Emticicia sp. BO119]MBA4849509.1 phage integrase SAM-like domain-containing protein [Emticicia sp. BO119]